MSKQLMLMSLVPLCLILFAPVLHIILCRKKANHKIKLSIALITVICLLLGAILPVAALIINVHDTPRTITCNSGAPGYLILGWFLAALVIPLNAWNIYITPQPPTTETRTL